MSTVDASTVTADTLRTTLVALVPEWEKRYGVAPFITAAVSEHDAARLVGHTPETFSLDCVGRTAVTRGTDFVATVFGIRSKLVGLAEDPVRSFTWVPKATNYEWDRLVWLLYDREFQLLEAWKWCVADFQSSFDTIKRLSPAHMRTGRRLHARV